MASAWFWSSLFIPVIISVLLLLSTSDALTGNETDRLALLEFKAKITDDPFGFMNSWNDTIHFCQWYGVTCSRRHERVTVLDLNSMKLSGSISPYIGNLSFLEVLDLKNNSFSHEIPPEIGRLRRLQILYLYNNSLSSEIPSNLSSCSNLVSLSLVNNLLVGKIPVELGSLLKLEFLSLSKNHLIGSVPPPIGNLSSLGTLSLAVNNLTGPIPDALGLLKKLTFLGLSLNQLSSTVPSSIFNLSSLRLLDIGDNYLQGHLPSDLFVTLPNIQDIALALNQFTGSIPSSISNASNIGFLQLQDNKLTGRVPSLERLSSLVLILISANNLGSGGRDDLKFLCSLTNASMLQTLVISNNNFGGMIPECIGSLSSELEDFEIDNNQISGSIPAVVGNLVNLMIVQANNNKLSGIIPQNVGFLQNLVILILEQNMLLGEIPSSFGNLTSLNRLHLAYNSLQGSIPSSLANCRNLQLLDVSLNNLSGTIPPEVIGLSTISIYFDLSGNQLTGPLPREIGNLKSLGILNISRNMLSGEIPSSLGSCVGLQYLDISGNLFQGSIPSSLSFLRGLQVINFSHNNLSGQIPDFLASFDTLLYLNLSFNDFEGAVPTEGAFMNANVTSVDGNSKLCGGIPAFHLRACNFRRSTKGLPVKVKVIIGAVAGLVGVTLLLSFVYVLRSRKKNQIPASPNSENSLLTLSYRDLHKATNGFASENLVGAGSFGSVYRGILNGGGMHIAVKVLNLQRRGAARSFMIECEALRSIRHRNLVKVLTACSSIDLEGNDFKALIYEFMPNGSLEEWLHHEEKILNLLERVNIAIDIASALEYLHQDCDPPIVHCDLKPSNVLLNEELTGHVSDFGLAKYLSDCSTNQSSSIGVRGTIGYAPPEYGLGSEISASGDVYSYGILLLEMFTGKRPIDDMFKEGWNLHKFGKLALPDTVSEVVDPVLLQESSGSSSITDAPGPSYKREDVVMECLVSIVEIGVACSAESPGERMKMSEAAAKLRTTRDKLVGKNVSRTALY